MSQTSWNTALMRDTAARWTGLGEAIRDDVVGAMRAGAGAALADWAGAGAAAFAQSYYVMAESVAATAEQFLQVAAALNGYADYLDYVEFEQAASSWPVMVIEGLFIMGMTGGLGAAGDATAATGALGTGAAEVTARVGEVAAESAAVTATTSALRTLAMRLLTRLVGNAASGLGINGAVTVAGGRPVTWGEVGEWIALSSIQGEMLSRVTTALPVTGEAEFLAKVAGSATSSAASSAEVQLINDGSLNPGSIFVSGLAGGTAQSFFPKSATSFLQSGASAGYKKFWQAVQNNAGPTPQMLAALSPAAAMQVLRSEGYDAASATEIVRSISLQETISPATLATLEPADAADVLVRAGYTPAQAQDILDGYTGSTALPAVGPDSGPSHGDLSFTGPQNPLQQQIAQSYRNGVTPFASGYDPLQDPTVDARLHYTPIDPAATNLHQGDPYLQDPSATSRMQVDAGRGQVLAQGNVAANPDLNADQTFDLYNHIDPVTDPRLAGFDATPLLPDLSPAAPPPGVP